MAPKTSSGYPVPKNSAPPLEPQRALLADPGDPRTQCIWPCQGLHTNVKTGSNGSGTWQHCQVCALRVSYTPRQGTPEKHAAHVDPSVVMAALNKLETDLPNGQMPTADLVRMVIKLILSQKELDALKTKVTLTTEKLNLMTELYQQMLSNPSTPPATNMERRAWTVLNQASGCRDRQLTQTPVASTTP